MTVATQGLGATLAAAIKEITRSAADAAAKEGERLAREKVLAACAAWVMTVGAHAKMETNGTVVTITIDLGREVFDSSDRGALMDAIFGKAK